MNALHFFFGVGAFLSPLIIAQAIRITDGISWGYWMLALAVVPVPVWLFRLPSPQARHQEENTAIDAAPAQLVALIALFFFIMVAAEASFGGWIATYAIAGDIPAEIGAYLTSAFWGALTLGRLLSIPIAARVRPRYILLADLIGCVISVGLLLIWPYSPVALWVGTCGMGLAMASLFPTTISLAERHMTVTGTVTGWFFVGSSAGGMTLPLLIGQLFDRVGPIAVMVVVFVDLVVAILIFAAMMAGFNRWSTRRPTGLSS
jgi:FHS family Na+ dependent glucose MFS transporter 1